MLQLILFIVFGIIMAVFANSKGYSPFAWFLAAGLLGLIILALLPNLKKGNFSPEELSKKARTGNIIGAVFSVIVVILAVVVAFASN